MSIPQKINRTATANKFEWLVGTCRNLSAAPFFCICHKYNIKIIVRMPPRKVKLEPRDETRARANGEVKGKDSELVELAQIEITIFRIKNDFSKQERVSRERIVANRVALIKKEIEAKQTALRQLRQQVVDAEKHINFKETLIDQFEKIDQEAQVEEELAALAQLAKTQIT